ncbi:MAG: hypothetical protein HRT87_08615, partial [Legionellales bacterium]|nr:hypothetical protein [Legionellales bacterium]
ISMDNTNITDIKAKFESALRDINDADKIKEFTTVRPVNESGKAYYKTQITDNNDQKIDVKISKDGSKSYLDGNFNEDSYKILIETFVRTHNITDTNQLQALNIPQQHIAKANEIIEEVINDYTNQNQIGLSMNNEM